MTLPFDPNKFSGVLPLFPLPNIVGFPHALIPLHIFEQRYRTMLRDAMQGEKYIGMVLLNPQGPKTEEGNPAVHPVGCLTRIIQDQKLADGRSNITLLGLERIRLIEKPSELPYRIAQAEILSPLPLRDIPDEDKIRETLLEAYLDKLADHIPEEVKNKLLTSDIPIEPLTDMIATALNVPILEKQKLLAEPTPWYRARVLQALLTGKNLIDEYEISSRPRTFPPWISLN